MQPASQRGNSSTREVQIYNMSSSVGKVTVGTEARFLSMSFREPGSDSSTTESRVPTQTCSRAAVSHLFLHCSPASPLVSSPPPLVQHAEFVVMFSGRSFFFGTWSGAAVTHAGSHDLLPFLQSYCLLTALGRKTVPRECGLIQCRLCWGSIVLNGNYVKVTLSSLKLSYDTSV